MTLPILNSEKAALLEAVVKADLLWRESVPTARSVGRLAEQEHIKKYADARDNRVRLAFDAGVPASRIHAEGLHTSSRSTLTASLLRTEGRTPDAVTIPDPFAERYALGPGERQVTVTIDGNAVPFAIVERHDGTTYTTYSGDDWASPVISWMDDASHEAEALAWFEAQR